MAVKTSDAANWQPGGAALYSDCENEQANRLSAIGPRNRALDNLNVTVKRVMGCNRLVKDYQIPTGRESWVALWPLRFAGTHSPRHSASYE